MADERFFAFFADVFEFVDVVAVAADAVRFVAVMAGLSLELFDAGCFFVDDDLALGVVVVIFDGCFLGVPFLAFLFAGEASTAFLFFVFGGMIIKQTISTAHIISKRLKPSMKYFGKHPVIDTRKQHNRTEWP